VGNTLLVGVVALGFGLILYILSIVSSLLTKLKLAEFTDFSQFFLRWSFYLALAFVVLLMLDLLAHKIKRRRREYVPTYDMSKKKFVVGLIAYNEEPSIVAVVKEFKKNPLVSRVIVVDNNSKDKTFQLAKEAGADIVVTEMRPGYDSACLRVLKECAAQAKQNEVVALTEADGTFSAMDLYKFLPYLGNADMVVGTRLCPEIVDRMTQLTPFYVYGNYFIAKLIHLKYYVRLTDVGCTFRVIHPSALKSLLPQLHYRGHAFSPHMIAEAIKQHLIVVEIPITFRKRIGVSKGAGGNIWLGWKTGLKMIADILRA